jgi:hypothetical protein
MRRLKQQTSYLEKRPTIEYDSKAAVDKNFILALGI